MKPLRFHPRVQKDVNEAIAYYETISKSLSDGIWSEIQGALEQVRLNPEAHHFDILGLRRINLKRFPYNILYLIKEDRIRVQAIRHNSRPTDYGSRRSRG